MKLILNILEDKLNIKQYLNIISNTDGFNKVTKLKLIPENINEYEKYGNKNNNIILLNDVKWFLIMLDKNNII